MWKCSFGVTLVPQPVPILIVLQSCVPIGLDKIPHINMEYWQSYEDLRDCLEPMKTLSILLESSMEAMIHYTLDYFLRLLYEVFEMAPKRRLGACTVFNTFVDVFRRNLLKLLYDVEQFFLWVVVATQDGRKTNFDWLALVWNHKDEWLNITKEYKNVQQLQFEVKRNLAQQVRDDLLLCISILLKCNPQAPTIAFGVVCKLCTGRLGDVVHPLLGKKVTAATIQQWSLREKNGGNQPCGSVRLWCHIWHAMLDRWRRSVKPWQLSGSTVVDSGNR